MNRITILMYHQVGDFKNIRTHRPTYCHYKRFATQMAFLSMAGFNVISLREAVACLQGRQPIPEKAVVLTFDDGYANYYQYAAPVLQKYGFPSTVYLLSQLIGKKSYWLEKDDHPAADLMDKQMIRELQQAGVHFGSHGRTHPRLSRIEAELARNEIFSSKLELEDLLGEAVDSFCYPYGDLNPAVTQMTRDAGYKTAVTCVRGAATPADDPWLLPRKAIGFGDNVLGFFWKVAMKHN